MENTKYNDQTSDSSSDNEGSGDSRESNSMRQHAADGANPELELLLSKSYSEPQITERQHMESRHAEWQQPESRHAKNQHAESHHAGSQHAVSQLGESQHAVSQYVESQLSKSRNPVSQHVESRHAEKSQHAISQHVGSRPSVYSYSRTSPYFSYPVIDMRKAHRIGMPHFHKIRNKSTQKNDLKFEVSQMFNVKSSKIYIIEEEGRKEEVLLKTIIVILPDNVGEECYPLIVEWYESMDHIHPQILCARMPVTWKVADVKKLLAEELCWKGLVLCQNGLVLEESMNLNSCNFRNLEKVQAMKQSCHRIEFIYQPRSDISCAYCLDVDMNWSVKQAKEQFETNFHAEIQKQKSNKESTIHFCFQDRLLEDKECVGLVLRKNIKEEKISIHFGSEDSISIDLKFRAGRKTRHKLLIVSKEISTAFLRAEVSKHLGVDPKAVKLTFEDKLIDEHDNLSQVYKTKWCSGCKIAAGVKKCKTLRIKHPTEWEEVPFEMYMLEPVSVLKSKIAERWGLKLLQISLFCRGIRMDHHQPLQYYPIKNNMEISLRLFKYRIVLKVVILKGKKRISLIIDDSHVTTVDDLLRFCAHHFSYARQRSRGIFKDHCLDRKCTLAEEGIESGDTVIISYFDQSDLLQGSLIKIFMVRKDGHIVQRIGTVSSGLLLHAQKTTETPQTEETSLDNGHVPEGIHVCENKEVGVSSMAARKLKLDEKRENNGEKKATFIKTIELSGCEGETSGCESFHDITYRPNITTNRQEKGTETDNSDIDHVTVSESAVALCDLLPLYQSQRHLPLNRTYPTFEGQLDRIPKPNADIETSADRGTIAKSIGIMEDVQALNSDGLLPNVPRHSNIRVEDPFVLRTMEDVNVLRNKELTYDVTKLKDNGLESDWENVKTEEDALALISDGLLPNEHGLSDVVHRLGRKSDVVELLCKTICKKIASASPNIIHAFAAYTLAKRDKLHFVVLLDNESSAVLNLDYEILCRNFKGDEKTEHEHMKKEIESELLVEESTALKNAVNTISKQYMVNHKYLSAITARKICSEGRETMCIVMYVHPCTDRYSSIPHNEEHIPSTIEGYKVVVRNGVFKTATKTASEYHDNVRMGCQITSNLVNAFGTLGGFIDHHEYGLCGFTCAHVVYGTEQMKRLKKNKRLQQSPTEDLCLVYQPSTSSEPIGRVVEAFYTEGGESQLAGVDLALFQIEVRPPVTGTFPRCNMNEKLKYVSGKTWGRSRLNPRACEVYKFGVVTGITHGKVRFDGMSVKELQFVAKGSIDSVDTILYNQYEIENDTVNVCEQGDSGGLVFMKDCAGELICIGMVSGVLDKDNPLHGVVTPITDILRELNVQYLKPFRKQLTLDILEKKLSENAEATRDHLRTANSDLLSQIRGDLKTVHPYIDGRVSELGQGMFTEVMEGVKTIIQSELQSSMTSLQSHINDTVSKIMEGASSSKDK